MSTPMGATPGPAGSGQPPTEEDFTEFLATMSDLAGYVATMARLAGPLTPAQAQQLGAPVREMLTASADLADMARHHGAMVILDPGACEICGTIDQPEFRHLTAEHYSTPGRELPDRVADALRELFDRILGLMTAKNRKAAEPLLLNLLDLAQDNLDAKAREEVVAGVLGRQPYPDCCAYHASGGRNRAYAHHEQVYAAGGQS